MYRHVVRKLHSFTFFWYLDCDPQRLAVELLVHYCPGGVDMALHGVPTVPARRECCALQVDFRVFHKRAYRKKERGREGGRRCRCHRMQSGVPFSISNRDAVVAI